MNQLIAAACFFASALVGAALTFDEGQALPVSSTAPLIEPASWAPRLGETIELRSREAAVRPESMDILVRHRGAQARLEAQSVDGAPRWRWKPEQTGTVVFTSSIELTKREGIARTCVYEKLLLRVRSADGQLDSGAGPSASAIARFGHRLELTPLVDPTHLRMGADLPIRVKLEEANLKNAAVQVRCEDSRDAARDQPRAGPAADDKPADRPRKEGDASDASPGEKTASTRAAGIQTNDDGIANVRIDRAGRWIISVVVDPTPGTTQAGEQLVGIMTFAVLSGNDAPRADRQEDQKKP